jgi:hypothetical protein
MQQGSSGGPLVDEQGRVLGVNVGMLTTDTSTKLAIPAEIASAYVRAARPAAVSAPAPRAPTAPTPPSAPTARTTGLVRDMAVGKDGTIFALLRDGRIIRSVDEGGWVSTNAGNNNADIAADDTTGDVYLVESDTGHLYRYDESTWTRVGDGANRSVAASQGHLWAVFRDGTLFHRAPGDGWRDMGVGAVNDVAACSGLVLVRVNASLYAWADDEWLNDGDPLRTDVKAVACHGEQVYAILDRGNIVDFADSRQIDASTDNVAIYAVPDGLLARTRDDRLWLWMRETGGWTELDL